MMSLGKMSITDYVLYPLVCRAELCYHACFIMTGERQVAVVSKQLGADNNLNDLYFPQRRTDDKPLSPNGLGNTSLCRRARSVKQHMRCCVTRVMSAVLPDPSTVNRFGSLFGWVTF